MGFGKGCVICSISFVEVMIKFNNLGVAVGVEEMLKYEWAWKHDQIQYAGFGKGACKKC